MSSQSNEENETERTVMLPCPFCGSAAILQDELNTTVYDSELARVCWVECESILCGAQGPKMGCQSDRYQKIHSLSDEAIKAWNERAVKYEDKMKNDIKFAVLHVEENTKQSVIRDTFTFLVLALCVWISKDCNVWTVISVAMFVVFGISQIFGSLGKETKKFKTKAELQQWVDGL